MNDFCVHCNAMVLVVSQATGDGTKFICTQCGRVTDFVWDDWDDWDDNE